MTEAATRAASVLTNKNRPVLPGGFFVFTKPVFLFAVAEAP
jgi:hypothetical protein